jgi:NDP-sugar pyrophosphorylase family protein
MRSSAPLAVAVVAVLLAAAPALAVECKVEVGPRDRVSRGEPLVIRAGERVDNAIAMHGDLVLERGAVVEKAVAIGGTVTVRSGASVVQDAVAISGDVVVEADARVGNDAVSLGGQVREEKGARVEGSVVGLAIQGGKSSLARQILKGISSLDGCTVSTVTRSGSGG